MSDLVEFSVSWGDDGVHVAGKLPPSVAARVLTAVMAPEATIQFDAPLSDAQVEDIRRRFEGRIKCSGGAS